MIQEIKLLMGGLKESMENSTWGEGSATGDVLLQAIFLIYTSAYTNKLILQMKRIIQAKNQ